MRKKTVVRQYMQYRAEDLKSLTEQRADLVQQMKDLTATVEMEQRAFSPEEDQKFDDLDKQVKALDGTIEKLERARDLKLNVISTEKHEELKQEELEERAFANYIRRECGATCLEVRITEPSSPRQLRAGLLQRLRTSARFTAGQPFTT